MVIDVGKQRKAFNDLTDSGNGILTRSFQVPADVFLRVILKGLLVCACTDTQSASQQQRKCLTRRPSHPLLNSMLGTITFSQMLVSMFWSSNRCL